MTPTTGTGGLVDPYLAPDLLPDPTVIHMFSDAADDVWLPYVTLRRRFENQWQFIYVVGMMHVAPPAFFEAIMTRIHSWQNQQPTLVFIEGVQPSDPPTAVEAAFLRWVRMARESTSVEVMEDDRYPVLVSQEESMPGEDGWFTVDLPLQHILELKNATVEEIENAIETGDDEEPDGFMSFISNLDSADEFRDTFAAAERETHLHQSAIDTFEHRNPTGLQHSHEKVLGIALPWGALHVPALVEMFTNMSNFEIRQRFWIRLRDGKVSKA